MDDHFLSAVAALKDIMAARNRGEFDKVSTLRFVGHGALFAADQFDDATPNVIGSSDEINQAAEDLRSICERITGKPFPKIPIGSPRGRNGEILRLALPIVLKFLLPLLIAEQGPEIASAVILSFANL